jgi:hypothetical protein
LKWFHRSFFSIVVFRFLPSWYQSLLIRSSKFPSFCVGLQSAYLLDFSCIPWCTSHFPWRLSRRWTKLFLSSSWTRW